MTEQMLYVHWKAVRLGLLPFVLAAFGLPLVVAQEMRDAGTALPSMPMVRVLGGTLQWMGFFPVIAGIIGCLLALSAWNWDHKANHVHALSLPISRQRYALIKFGAGALLALIPVGAVLLGSLVAAAATDVPAGLNAYPVQLAGRFLSCILVAYAVVFALAAGTIRTTVIVLCVLIVVPILLSTGPVRPFLGDFPATYWVAQGLQYGPFRVFFGNWVLFDV